MDEQIIIQRTIASTNKYFDSKRGSIRMYVEGQNIDMATLNEWAEVRIDGPRIRKLNHQWDILIDVNILCSVRVSNNAYRATEIAGLFAKSMDSIPIFQENDDKIGCFALRNDVEHQLEIVNWGQLVPEQEISVYAASIEGFYKMEIPV
jgi:hypothetical protein